MAHYNPKHIGERMYHFWHVRPNRDRWLKWRNLAHGAGYCVACQPDYASGTWWVWSDRSRALMEAKERKAKGGAE